MTAAEKARLLQLQKDCWDLYVAGTDFRSIAAAMTANGKKMSPSTAFRYVQAVYAMTKSDLTEEAEQQKQQQREVLLNNIQFHTEIRDDASRPIKERLQAARQLREDGESLRKLFGLDAPKGLDVTSKGEPVVGLVGVNIDEI